MIIDLNALGERSKTVDTEIDPKEIELELENVRTVSPIHLVCAIEHSDFRTNVDGTIAAQLDIDCTRCLEAVKVPLEFTFDVEFVDAAHFGSSGEHEIDAKDLSTDALFSEQLDLNDLIREQILLSLPERVFCKEDCKGLCEICGTNRNLKDCNCSETEVDPRWSALKDLK
jgi:uncharacterized protein